MSFQEKSAWGVLLGLAIVSWFYFPAAFAVVASTGNAVPLVALIAFGVAVLVVIEVVYHTVIAVESPREAGVVDERDRLIDLKAERNGGFALGLSLFWLIGWIIAQSILGAYPVPQPLEIVVWMMLAITFAEMVKLLSQIIYYRFSV